ncbi:MAG: PAS domain S-box protein, partial [candidate division Zixibacteria bacterium]|nr:PAS domain S-box protein [candidate division Zixibacteria bacterium]
AQTKRLAEGSDHAVVSERYCRSDEIGDIIRNHNRIIYGIRDARERYQALVEGLDAVIYEANASTQRFTYVSPQLQSLLGYPADTWTNDPGSWVHQLHPDDRADAMTKWLEEKSPAREHHIEYRLQRVDGQYVWVRDVMRVVNRIDRGSGLPYRQLQGMIFDISKEKVSEQQLRDSESKYRALFENMLDAFALHEIVEGPDGAAVDYVFLEVNDAFERHTGLKRDQLVGKRITEVFPKIVDDPTGWVERYGLVAQGGHAERFESFSEPLQRWYSIYAFSPQAGQFATIFEDITERKRAEAELKIRGVIIDSSSDAIVTTDVNGIITGWNRGAEHIFGYQKDEVLGQSIALIYREQERDRLEEYLSGGRGGQEFCGIEMTCPTRDGREIDVLVTITALRDDDGRVTGLFGITKDITDLKNSERALRKSEAQFRATFNNAGVGMAIVSPEGALIDCNATMQNIVGYTHEELVQRSFMDITHPEDVETDLALAQELFAGQRDVYKLEKRFIRKDGEVRWVRLTATAVHDEAGNVCFGVGMNEDITEQKELEAHLRSFKEAIDYAGDALYWVNENGAFRYVNRAAQDALGYSEAELLTMHVWDIDPNMPRDRWPDHCEDLKKSGSLSFEMEHRRRDGSQFPVQIIASVMTVDGETTICAFARDISEMKASERRLRDSESRHRLLLEHAGLGIGYYDTEGRCLLMNQKACENLRSRPEDLVGYSVNELFGGDLGRRMMERITHVVSSGEHLITEEDIEVPAGRIYFRSTWTPIRGESGDITGVQIISEDITDRRRSEDALRDANNRLNLALEATSAGVFDWVPDIRLSRIIATNGRTFSGSPVRTCPMPATLELGLVSGYIRPMSKSWPPPTTRP